MRVGLLVGAPLVLVVLVLAGLALAHGGEALPGTWLEKTDLSGLGEQDLTARVTDYAGTLGRREVALTTPDGRSASITADQVGFTPDVAATVAAAMSCGRTGSWWSRLGAEIGLPWVADRQVQLRSAVDQAKLTGAVDEAATQADRKRVQGGFTVDGATVTQVKPVDGFATDRPAARRAVQAALADPTVSTLQLPGRADPSGVDPKAVALIADQARQRLTRPLTLVDGSRQVVLSPASLGPLLSAKIGEAPAGGGLRPVTLAVDEENLAALVDARATAQVDRKATNATFSTRATGAAPTLDSKGTTTWTAVPATATGIKQAQTGLMVDRDASVAAAQDALVAGRTQAPLTVKTVEPQVRLADVAKIDQVIGTFTTYHTAGQPRVTNIHRMADIVDGTVVGPGESFSLNGVVGKRTLAGGFVPDGAIVNGEIEDQVGGGVSQFSTTLFNAVFFAGLQVDRHKPHSFYISRYPPGREATLNFPTIDNRWTNSTGAPVVVRTAYTATSVTVTLYGDNGGLTVTGTTGPRQDRPGGGFVIEVVRTTSAGGKNTFRTVYDPPPAGH